MISRLSYLLIFISIHNFKTTKAKSAPSGCKLTENPLALHRKSMIIILFVEIQFLYIIHISFIFDVMLSLFYISLLLHKTLFSSYFFLGASQEKNKPMNESIHSMFA